MDDLRFGCDGVQLQSRDPAGLGVFQGAHKEVARTDGGTAQQDLAPLKLLGRDVAAQQGCGRDARRQRLQGAGQHGGAHVPAPLQQHVQRLVAVALGRAVHQGPGQRRQVAFFHVQATHQSVAAGMEGDVSQRVARRDQVQRVERQVVVGAFFLAHGQDDAGSLAGGILQRGAQQLVVVRAGRDLGEQDVDGHGFGVTFGDAVDQRGQHRARPGPASHLQHADVVDVHDHHLTGGQPGIVAQRQVVQAQAQVVGRRGMVRAVGGVGNALVAGQVLRPGPEPDGARQQQGRQQAPFQQGPVARGRAGHPA